MAILTEIEILEGLENGQTIDYAPLTGGVLLVDSIARKSRTIDVNLFLDLRKRKIIKKTRTMRQGHSIFRSVVDIYEVI